MQRLGWLLSVSFALLFFHPADIAAKDATATKADRLNNTLEKGVILKTNFEYASKERSVKTEKRIFLADRDNKWINLTKPRDGIVLLGRMLQHDQAVLEMEYMIIDTNKDNAVLATPAIKTQIGKRSIINLDRPSEKITLSFVSKTTGPQ